MLLSPGSHPDTWQLATLLTLRPASDTTTSRRIVAADAAGLRPPRSWPSTPHAPTAGRRRPSPRPACALPLVAARVLRPARANPAPCFAATPRPHGRVARHNATPGKEAGLRAVRLASEASDGQRRLPTGTDPLEPKAVRNTERPGSHSDRSPQAHNNRQRAGAAFPTSALRGAGKGILPTVLFGHPPATPLQALRAQANQPTGHHRPKTPAGTPP
jgi:hypothetical protein